MNVAGTSDQSEQAGPPAHDPGLHQQPLMPDLLIAALNRNLDKPRGLPRRHGAHRPPGARRDQPLRPGARRRRASARAARWRCSRANRPEVLFNMGANMLIGCRSTPLHPHGLARRPRLRARGRRHRDARVRPDVLRRAGRRSCASGCPASSACWPSGPADDGDDLHRARRDVRAAAAGRARRRRRATCPGLAYTGGTTGKPKGVMGTLPRGATMTNDPDDRVGVARRAALPDLHAAQPRRRRLLHPDAAARRLDRRAARLRARAGARDHREAPHHRHDARADDALRAARPPRLRRRTTCRASRPSTTAPPPCRRPG